MMKINSGGTTISVSQAIAVRKQSSHSLHIAFLPVATVTQIRDRLPVSESLAGNRWTKSASDN